QLARIRPGMTADVHVDTFTDRVFRGKVDSLSAGTGARFSLLPPENATGNWVKVVQRLPVKIRLDPGQFSNPHTLRAGLSPVVTGRLSGDTWKVPELELSGGPRPTRDEDRVNSPLPSLPQGFGCAGKARARSGNIQAASAWSRASCTLSPRLLEQVAEKGPSA